MAGAGPSGEGYERCCSLLSSGEGGDQAGVGGWCRGGKGIQHRVPESASVSDLVLVTLSPVTDTRRAEWDWEGLEMVYAHYSGEQMERHRTVVRSRIINTHTLAGLDARTPPWPAHAPAAPAVPFRPRSWGRGCLCCSGLSCASPPLGACRTEAVHARACQGFVQCCCFMRWALGWPVRHRLSGPPGGATGDDCPGTQRGRRDTPPGRACSGAEQAVSNE